MLNINRRFDFTGKYLFDHLAVGKFLKAPPSGDIKGSKPDIFQLYDQSQRWDAQSETHLIPKSCGELLLYKQEQTKKNAKNEVYWKFSSFASHSIQ